MAVNVACMMMQKNEGYLLKLWGDYHGSLFGNENLYIFDNASDDEETKSALQILESSGVNISRKFSTKADFEKKGEIILQAYNAIREDKQFDFLIPIDCDEFIGSNCDNRCSASTSDILDHLEALKEDKRVLKISKSFLNIPGTTLFYPVASESKCFFARDACASLDIGFHDGRSKYSTSIHKTRLLHFHFRNKPYKLFVKHARAKLEGRVNVDDISALRNYRGKGRHLARALLMDEHEFYETFSKKEGGREIPSLALRMAELGYVIPYSRSGSD